MSIYLIATASLGMFFLCLSLSSRPCPTCGRNCSVKLLASSSFLNIIYFETLYLPKELSQTTLTNVTYSTKIYLHRCYVRIILLVQRMELLAEGELMGWKSKEPTGLVSAAGSSLGYRYSTSS
jgi:hypothetical protein